MCYNTIKCLYNIQIFYVNKLFYSYKNQLYSILFLYLSKHLYTKSFNLINMNKEIKQVLLPLGIGLTTLGVIFSSTIDKIFFSLIVIGIILIILSSVKRK